MKYFTHSARIMGGVTEVNKDDRMFKISCQSGDSYSIYVGTETSYSFIRNLDLLDRDRTIKPKGDIYGTEEKLSRYIKTGIIASAYGVFQIHEQRMRFDAKEVTLFHNSEGNFLFEETHWWLTQVSALADQWLMNLFGTGNDFDYSNYQTNLSYIGSKLPDSKQECATLSRLIYGLSSAYLMTGNDRYYRAARRGVEYQRDIFRTESHDGSFIVWAHAYDKVNGKKILPSTFEDDKNTIPLYEQIYAIAGLSQFYRITNDWETLDDIRRTLELFNQRFKDKKYKGYFSHIDYATFLPDTPALGDNCLKKNWNSIGDHTPAYLLNLLLAIDNIPNEEFSDLYKECIKMQIDLADLIVEKFPDPDNSVPYVRERFQRNWDPDTTYKWQKDRAVIGHNLKIAWNMTRIYNLLKKKEYLELAKKLGDSMKTHGLDQVRGGWFDVVERKPGNNMPVEFTWHNRKAWWQQEQGILAYLMLYGATHKPEYLQLAKESLAFWNMAFLDYDYREIYFDVLEDGLPYVKEDRAMKGSHSKSGYHVFELNYLAHIYIHIFFSKEPFRLYFKPCKSRTNDIINVLPDYLPDGSVTMGKVSVNGREHPDVDRDNFQVQVKCSDDDLEVAVEFKPVADYKPYI